MSELNVFMKTKIPSELVGSPSSVPSRLCRKKPNWLAPLVVRASVRWVMTPRMSYSVLLPASGEPSVRGFSVSSVEPWTSPMLSTGAMTWTVNEQLAVPPCASVEVIVTPYDPAGVSAASEISAVAVPPSAGAGDRAGGGRTPRGRQRTPAGQHGRLVDRTAGRVRTQTVERVDREAGPLGSRVEWVGRVGVARRDGRHAA